MLCWSIIIIVLAIAMKTGALLDTVMNAAKGAMKMMGSPTPVFAVSMFGRSMYVKRDDLCADHTSSININGNKARKFRYLMDSRIDSISLRHTTIASCGGYQSNAMLALAKIAMSKNINFYYFTRDIPSHVKSSLVGNLKVALNCGMTVS